MFLDVILGPAVLNFLHLINVRKQTNTPETENFFLERKRMKINLTHPRPPVLKSCRNEKLNFCRSFVRVSMGFEKGFNAFNILSSEKSFSIKMLSLESAAELDVTEAFFSGKNAKNF
jgi:hypothetical protein